MAKQIFKIEASYKVMLCICVLMLFKNATAQVDTIALNENAVDTIAASLDSTTKDTLSNIWTFDNFKNQSVEITDFKKKQPFAEGWFFILNLVLLLIFVLKYFLFNEYVRKSWNAWVNNNLFFQFVREKQPINVLIFAFEFALKVYVFSILFFLAKFLITKHWQLHWVDFRNILLIISVFFAVKYLLTFMLTFITNQLEEYKVLGLNNIVFISNFTWFVIPSVLLIVYSDFNVRQYLIYTLFVFLILGWLAYIYKCFTVAVKMRIRLNVHFFIYLCAFEILPFLFLGKMLQNLNFVYG